jgi:hypothetical protein
VISSTPVLRAELHVSAIYGKKFKFEKLADITMPAKFFVPQILAPIKRPLSRENTSPMQKMMSFFAGSVSSSKENPFCYLLPCFQVFWCKSLTDLLPGTHQDQGHLRKIKLTVAKRRDLHYLLAKQPFFLYDPWSGKRTPEKYRYLVMSNGL